MSANDKQVGGDHYGGGDLQHWDVVNRFGLDYFQGQITKYIFRWKKKDGIKDLQKAAHFLEKYIELNQPIKSAGPHMMTEEDWYKLYKRYALEGQFGDGKMKLKCLDCGHYIWGHSSRYSAHCVHQHECKGNPTKAYVDQDGGGSVNSEKQSPEKTSGEIVQPAVQEIRK